MFSMLSTDLYSWVAHPQTGSYEGLKFPVLLASPNQA